MVSLATSFLAAQSAPGLWVAVARRGELVYEQAFGFADRQTRERLSTSHTMRIASVTKPFTSATIFSLIERGQIKLDDVVFGPGGLLRGDFGEPPYKPYVGQIRIRHLLTHTCGGWPNDGTDPMFSHPGMDHKQLITWAIANVPLTSLPGQHYAYSNFGYCILGRVIEKVTGMRYDKAVRDLVLGDRAEREVVYYGQGGEDPYGMKVRRMDSHGGWIATASNLVRFASHVDGMSAARDILKPATIQEMTAPSAANHEYAKGWSVNDSHNWWHTGSLPGTTSIIVRTGSGLCWAALVNTRETKADTGTAIDALMWNMVKKVRGWRA